MSKQRNQGKSFANVRRHWIWIMLMVNLVFILLLMTLGVVALQVGALPNNYDMLFVVAKKPSVSVGDYNGGNVSKWESGKSVQVFQSSYQNGEGKVTVASQQGNKLFAPGTTAQYTFAMQNDGNVAVDYLTDLQLVLQVSGNAVDGSDFPVKVRLFNDKGDYLIGSSDSYTSVSQAVNKGYLGLLGANSFDVYTLELHWPFNGNDDVDSALGNLAHQVDVSLTLNINVYAEESADPTAQGGNKVNDSGNQEYGGTVRWLWLILLIINCSVLIFYVAWLLNKRAIDSYYYGSNGGDGGDVDGNGVSGTGNGGGELTNPAPLADSSVAILPLGGTSLAESPSQADSSTASGTVPSGSSKNGSAANSATASVSSTSLVESSPADVPTTDSTASGSVPSDSTVSLADSPTDGTSQSD